MIIKRQIILSLIACVIISLALILLFVYPMLGKIKKESIELISLKKEIIITNNKKGGIAETKGICVLGELDLKRAQDVFTSLDVPVKLIEFFENEANNANLSIIISPVSLKEIDDDLWSFVGFRVSLFGSYVNFMKFFERLESNQFLIEVQDLSIKRLTKSEIDEYSGVSANDIRASLNLRIFAK